MSNTSLDEIPGIGKKFVRDFARVGVTCVEQLVREDPAQLFERLVATNHALGHATSKNYLYVIRMAVYWGNGGRDPELLRWAAWSDRAMSARALVEVARRVGGQPRKG